MCSGLSGVKLICPSPFLPQVSHALPDSADAFASTRKKKGGWAGGWVDVVGGTVRVVGTSGCMTWARVSLELVSVGVAAVEAVAAAAEEEEEKEAPGGQNRGFRDEGGERLSADGPCVTASPARKTLEKT